jgi:hypothetical protein
MKEQGYVGLKYINTSPMETAQAKDPTSYVIFNPQTVRNKLTGATMMIPAAIGVGAAIGSPDQAKAGEEPLARQPKPPLEKPKPPLEENYAAATRQLKLNPQEQYLYQTHLENLDKGGVPNPKGGTSTLFVTTVGVGGRTYVIPTVWDMQIMSPQEAEMRALSEGIEKFPSYKSEAEAEKRYKRMHEYMEQDLMKSKERRGGGEGKTKLAGDVIKFTRPQQTYGPGTDWEKISQKNKALATQVTLMRALGAQNVLPIRPEDKE